MTTAPLGLKSLVLDRLAADPTVEGNLDLLILAALDGPAPLRALLDTTPKPKPPTPAKPAKTATSLTAGQTPATADEPLGAYLGPITVEGFRGIGPKTTLDLQPGPGLTLVMGRNGSGKSSFAEALELLLTGATYRWEKRAKVWSEGWRNLHHQPAAIEAQLSIEGEKGIGLASKRWEDDDDLDAATGSFQIHGKPRTDLSALGWTAALATYRPFLSYNELGSLLEEGPSKLYDALASILGLEELTAAQDTLGDARKAREKAHKEAGEMRAKILDTLRQTDDDRARALVTALEKKDWGLDEAESTLAKATSGAGSVDSDLQLLQQLAALRAPTAEAAAALAGELRTAQKRQQAAAGTLAARAKDLAEILDRAIQFHEKYGDGDCPVCGRPQALDQAWHQHQAQEATRLRDAAKEATAAQQAVDAALKRAQALIPPPPEALARAAQVGLADVAKGAAQALDEWRKGLAAHAADADRLAAHIDAAVGPLQTAIASLHAAAEADVQKREDRWRPLMVQLAAWLVPAKDACRGAEAVKNLKDAESWLKKATAAIRNERFAPIKQKAQEVWNQLRLQSNVSLDDIQLSGSATKRQVDLSVTVDGSEGAALAVMSQGELHSLALSLFIPRATLRESPFRFIVIDDPVQSMDPARVDGLARVLESAARSRQVVVFTHDDRLASAVHRLDIEATVMEVTRREKSVVELRIAKDPVTRYIEDAMTMAKTDNLPPQVARRVIPGFCRLAIEAACMESVRRRRLGRGEPHAAIEDLLAGVKGTKALAALALFDDPQRQSEVLPRLDKEARELADTFRWCNEGAHEEQAGPLVDQVRGTEKLVRWLRGRP